MRIDEVHIKNYKAIRSIDLKLSGNITIIIGVNNSGKTAILEAIGLQLSRKPNKHLSSNDYANPTAVSFTIKSTPEDLQLTEGQSYGIESRSSPSNFIERLNYHHSRHEHTELLIDYNYFDRIEGKPDKIRKLACFFGIDLGKIDRDNRSTFTSRFIYENQQFSAPSAGLPYIQLDSGIISELESSIYYVTPNRRPEPQTPVGTGWMLKNDFSNLSEVLSNLLSNFGLYQKYCDTLNYVLPNIKRYTTRNVKDNKVEILIWESESDESRIDLAIPLSDVGSGIGQILGLLYLIIVRKNEQILVIDEVSNYLHPAATRRFMNIIKQNNQNQYIISTHSTELIDSSIADLTYLVGKSGDNLSIVEINKSDFKQMSDLLQVIGSSISDLYGTEYIFWVEGPTEEVAFRHILNHFYNFYNNPIIIKGVLHTGDFEGSEDLAERVYKIYVQLSNSNAFLPKSVGFLFDSEGRSKNKLEDLKRLSSGNIHFLKRRLFENYLLVPEILSKIIYSDLEDYSVFSDIESVSSAVLDWLTKYHCSDKYIRNYPPKPEFLQDESWLQKVDAAKLLKDLFDNISEHKLSFQKTNHSVRITELIIKEKPHMLKELADELIKILQEK